MAIERAQADRLVARGIFEERGGVYIVLPPKDPILAERQQEMFREAKLGYNRDFLAANPRWMLD